jgi:hypothetical protein
MTSCSRSVEQCSQYVFWNLGRRSRTSLKSNSASSRASTLSIFMFQSRRSAVTPGISSDTSSIPNVIRDKVRLCLPRRLCNLLSFSSFNYFASSINSSARLINEHSDLTNIAQTTERCRLSTSKLANTQQIEFTIAWIDSRESSENSPRVQYCEKRLLMWHISLCILMVIFSIDRFFYSCAKRSIFVMS